MNWKTEAVEKLRRYENMCRAVKSLSMELQRLEAESEALRSGAWVCVGGNANVRKQEDRMLDNMLLRKELTWALDQAYCWINLVDNALAGLSREEQTILRRMYMASADAAMDRLCNELGMERSSIYRHRDKALEKFTRCLYGSQESN